MFLALKLSICILFPVPPSIPPAMKSYAPIESVVRKPTTIAQVSTNIAAASSGHVAVAATGINPMQLMTSHSPTASVAVVSMGKWCSP